MTEDSSYATLSFMILHNHQAYTCLYLFKNKIKYLLSHKLRKNILKNILRKFLHRSIHAIISRHTFH